jgi:hypothetical protein
MDSSQRRVIALAAFSIALVLFVFYFARPLWAWMTWDSKQGTFDFGILKVNTRPLFPNDGKSVGLGLILPIALAATGRVLGQSKSS